MLQPSVASPSTVVKPNIIDERTVSPQINSRNFLPLNDAAKNYLPLRRPVLHCGAFVARWPKLQVIYKLEASNGLGKSSLIGTISILPFRFARITGTSPQNSQMSWRQAPHGGVSVSVSVTTEMASNPRSPSLMALKMATRSAHTVRP